ncbi:hypothetical protein KUTeg_020804 [Tegillarca granosa]|uniref:DDE-1 domain-containing protein n=1 Tax=Tegillarca granosa TaxID=220873 RepID=A0ABQ9ED62_TEGGR|nr:hypothetical protein KUTeg_020804 [Tegillarca granosa]
MTCVNAAGDDIPALIIVKGLTEKALRAYNISEGPVGAKYRYQKKARMEDVLGVSWFQDHFLKHCGPECPQIIILNSHSSHETLCLIEAARDNEISLFALHPHTTKYLNFLYKTVLGPFQREYNKQCTDFMSMAPNNLITKWEWPRIFKQAYTKTVNSVNITKGFEVCGIFPFNPNKIPESAFALSLAFVNPVLPSSSSVAFSPEEPENTNYISQTISSDKSTENVIIATADEHGNEALLELIKSGQLDVIAHDENENLTVSLENPPQICINSDSTTKMPASRNTEIKNVFHLPVTSEIKSPNIKNKKKLTKKEQKERNEREKEERKIKRMEKKEKKHRLAMYKCYDKSQEVKKIRNSNE